ncbi:hypothetical protein CQZ94_29295 [Bacillus sp. MYb209]|uniref:hypothetical protein n=1 Tax=Bacillus sp. MYb209 TaxID=1848605 RepID=UPI000CFB80BB|nr:hypothetical protein [Bacillus sp. MYb209]PQZ46481.1 hypothetical protein CQZ94_29295 [Bacillus sp. MYb209]
MAGNVFGPDNNKGIIDDLEHIGWVTVPPGKRVKFTFGSSANWENCICIYNADTGNPIKKHEAGTPPRHLVEWTTDENTTGQNVAYRVTGWHKESGPSSGAPWIQSRVKENPFQTDQGNFQTYGFEDRNDNDFDDIWATAEFQD